MAGWRGASRRLGRSLKTESSFGVESTANDRADARGHHRLKTAGRHDGPEPEVPLASLPSDRQHRAGPMPTAIVELTCTTRGGRAVRPLRRRGNRSPRPAVRDLPSRSPKLSTTIGRFDAPFAGIVAHRFNPLSRCG